MVATKTTTVLGVAGLVLGLSLSGCGSIQVSPEAAPHYVYLGATAAEIGTSGELTNEKLADEMAKGMGWWLGFRLIEAQLEAAVGRPLAWWESALFWVLPTLVRVTGIIDNTSGGPMQ